MKFDLHVHTNCSDGSDTPEELLEIAKQADLQGISITDHDTVDAYRPEVFAKASSLSIKLLPGIELSTEWKDQSIHLLGYGIDPEDAGLKLFLEELISRRGERNRAILARLAKKGLFISEEEITPPIGSPRRTTGRPHIAYAMMQKGYVSNMQEAFEKYLREGASCFVPGIIFTPQEGIDGLLYPEQEAPWIKIAKQKGWIATGGSDYHGSFKPQIKIGCSWVSEEVFLRLGTV
jgi:predicted metal-dependent phosphoesterase TrpH